MLQVIEDTIQEIPPTLTTTVSNNYIDWGTVTTGGTGVGLTTHTVYQPYYYYGNYPVYICTDKTKKAIDILKHLQAKKKLRVDDVEKFIALVEEIAGIL